MTRCAPTHGTRPPDKRARRHRKLFLKVFSGANANSPDVAANAITAFFSAKKFFDNALIIHDTPLNIAVFQLIFPVESLTFPDNANFHQIQANIRQHPPRPPKSSCRILRQSVPEA